MKSIDEICKLYPNLLSLHLGDSNTSVKGISAQEDPLAETLVFLSKPEALANVLSSKAAGIVIPEEFTSKVPEGLKINILTSTNTRLALALLITELNENRLDKQLSGQKELKGDVHPTAYIHPTASIGEGVRIGPFAFIGENTNIGNKCIIGASAVIQSDSSIGDECRLHEQSFVGSYSILGRNCEVFPQAAVGTEGFGYAQDGKGAHVPIPHQGGVVLGDYVHVGSGTKIDRGTFGNTSIGDHTKIDNLCHIAHNCSFGKSCLVTAGYMSAGSTKIGDNFVCGGRTTVTGHIEITDNVQVGGLSGVQKSITKPGKYQGFPIAPHKEGLKNMLASARLGNMRADLKKVLKKLNIEETK